MKKILVGIVAVAVLFLGACSKNSYITDDGHMLEDVSQQTVVAHTQKDIEQHKAEQIAEAIKSSTTPEQAILVAFWLGNNKPTEVVVTKNGMDYTLDFLDLFLRYGGAGGILDMGNQKNGSISIKTGDGATISGFNQLETGRDIGFSQTNSKTSSVTTDKQTTITTDYDKQDNDTYNVGE